MFNPFRKAPTLETSARDAVAVFEQLRNALNEVIALIQKVSALNLRQAEQDLLTREFTNLAAAMRQAG